MQTLPEQRLNCPASPQRKAQLILCWRLVAEQSLELLLLPRAQRALLAWLTPSRLGLDTPNPRLSPLNMELSAAVSRAVFVHGDIQHPMQAILNGPMGASHSKETLG